MSVTFNPFTGNLDFNDTTKASGSDTQIQFNDGGKLSGDSGLVFNKTTDALTIAGPVIHPLGAAATPSLTFTGDPNTGLYSPGANQVAISTNGTGRLTVGTTAVSSTLAVDHPLGAVGTPSITFTGDLNTGFWSPAADTLAASTGGSERLRILSDGKVGLGTSSPAQQLHVLGSGAAIRVDNSDVGTNVYGDILSATGGTFRIRSRGGASTHGSVALNTWDGTNDLTRLFVSNAGNVGIGTTSPGVALHVDGDIRCDGVYGETDTNTSIQFPGSDVITFNEGGSEAARIDSSGRLLVGTSTARTNLFGSSSTMLQLENLGNSSIRSGLSCISGRNTAGGGGIVDLAHHRTGSVGGNNTLLNNDTLGTVSFLGADGTNLVPGAQINAEVDGTPGANDMPGRLVFSTTPSGSSSPTERLRITNAGVLQVADAGNISVGTTTGTKIGTATTQKLSFYNATPVVQPTAVADATDAATAISQLNALLAHMRTLGLIAT